MNRFRRKKEAKEIFDSPVRPSTESETPLPPPFMKTLRRGKKTSEIDAKQEIDLSTALPSSDDFRTSLLMSGLSARFSMLRELEDPKSTFGKTSDDNLTLLKSFSKNNILELRAHDLSDISEVSSIHSSLPPPTETSGSTSVGLSRRNDTTKEHPPPRSIMDRARPGEGNVLFGGRQKINVGNRILYDADVHLTAFQKQRRREREIERLSKEETDTLSTTSPSSNELNGTSNFTSPESNIHVNNSSYTTNVKNSQGTYNQSLSKAQESPAKKTHRLYNVGFDDSLHQQASSVIKINTLIRQQSQSINALSPAASPIGTLSSQGSPHQNFQKQQFLPPFKGIETVGNLSIFNSPNFGLFSPPLSPPSSENDETTSLASQFTNNELKIRLSSTSSDSYKTSNEDECLQVSSPRGTNLENSSLKNSRSTEQMSYPLEQSKPSSLTGSNSSYGSSLASNSTPAQSKTPSEWSYTSAVQSSNTPKSHPQPQPNSCSSTVHFDLDYFRRTTNIERPSISEHPMNRDQPFVVHTEESSTDSSIQASPEKSSSSFTEPESTLPSQISKMVKRHMRNPSIASSIYGAVPQVIHDDSVSHYPGIDSLNEYLTNSNPWEADWDLGCENSTETPKSRSQDYLPCLVSGKSQPDTHPTQHWDQKQLAWKDDAEYNHARQESTDTQREQEDLRNELASRRRQVQEKMRSFVESDSRSTSPLPLPEIIKDGLSKSTPFGLLRTKTSRSSVKSKDVPLKTKKVIGRGNTTAISLTGNDMVGAENGEDVEVAIGMRKPSPPHGAKGFRISPSERELQTSIKSVNSEPKKSDHAVLEPNDENQSNSQQQGYPSHVVQQPTSDESRKGSLKYLQPDTSQSGYRKCSRNNSEKLPESHRTQTQTLSSKIPSANFGSAREYDANKQNAESTPARYRTRHGDTGSNSEKSGKLPMPSFPSKSRPALTSSKSSTPILENSKSSRCAETRLTSGVYNGQNQIFPIQTKNLEYTTSNPQNTSPNLHVANFLRNY
ncbi:hypothetical protein K3495_g9448 [Podosphaera aphanis]|nr:hypothetical protein K3495_g9448 [Podosphaera aphanis]